MLVVAFTAAALRAEWGLNPAALGGLLSAGLAGMGVGALAGGAAADRFGRRPAVLACLLLLIVGMPLSALAGSPVQFALTRFFTGLGIGGVLANINIVVVENAPERRRKIAIALLTVGYPVGATLGGSASIYLLNAFGWRSVYWFGGVVGLLLLPLALRFIPESLPAAARRVDRAGMSSLFGAHLGATVAASVAYFSVMMTAYFLLSWTPATLTSLGLSATTGISGSMLMNVGGAAGCLLYGFYAGALGPRRVAIAMTLGLGIMSAVFGLLPAEQRALMIGALLVGFCLYSSITVLYAVIPETFPAAVRATGTGWAMSMGRLGAVAGPALAGLLINAGWSRAAYFGALALPMIAAAVAIAALRPATQPAAEVSA